MFRLLTIVAMGIVAVGVLVTGQTGGGGEAQETLVCATETTGVTGSPNPIEETVCVEECIDIVLLAAPVQPSFDVTYTNWTGMAAHDFEITIFQSVVADLDEALPPFPPLPVVDTVPPAGQQAAPFMMKQPQVSAPRNGTDEDNEFKFAERQITFRFSEGLVPPTGEIKLTVQGEFLITGSLFDVSLASWTDADGNPIDMTRTEFMMTRTVDDPPDGADDRHYEYTDKFVIGGVWVPSSAPSPQLSVVEGDDFPNKLDFGPPLNAEDFPFTVQVDFVTPNSGPGTGRSWWTMNGEQMQETLSGGG